MVSHKSIGAVLAAIGLALAAVMGWRYLIDDASDGRTASARRSEVFQEMVGGLGCGPALDLSDCAFSFDPRLEGNCAFEFGPFPGGGCYCPFHASAVNLGDPPLPLELAR